MKFKIKLKKCKLKRLQNYINSNFYNQNDLIFQNDEILLYKLDSFS